MSTQRKGPIPRLRVDKETSALEDASGESLHGGMLDQRHCAGGECSSLKSNVVKRKGMTIQRGSRGRSQERWIGKRLFRCGKKKRKTCLSGMLASRARRADKGETWGRNLWSNPAGGGKNPPKKSARRCRKRVPAHRPHGVIGRRDDWTPRAEGKDCCC